MLVEQRVYTLFPGKVGEYLKAYRDRGNAIQEPTLGRFLGYFHTEVGRLNQVIHMWGYKDAEERSQRRARQNSDPLWIEYAEQARTLIFSQENRLLRPDPFTSCLLKTCFSEHPDEGIASHESGGASPAWVIEMETMVIRPGALTVHEAVFEAVRGYESKALGTLLGRYVSMTGLMHQCISLRAYQSFHECLVRREKLESSSEWCDAIVGVMSSVLSVDRQLMHPVPFWLPQLDAILQRARLLDAKGGS